MKADPRPPLPLTSAHALFLDLDGTLLELAPTPDAVVVPHDLPRLLESLSTELGGAVAIVTGRALATVDALLAPWTVMGAGLHGAEFRWPGMRSIDRLPLMPVEEIVGALRDRFRGNHAIRIEDKGVSVALHYRLSPERQLECEEAISQATSGRPDLRLMHGHFVIEALPITADKGSAILSLTKRAPFANRIPVFVGDDQTDEEAFPVVTSLGGTTVRVAATSTRATHGLASPSDVVDWLRSSLGLLISDHRDARDR